MANSAYTPTFGFSDGSVTEQKLAAGATLKLADEQTSASGTNVDFTGIPSGTKQIIVMFEAVSFNDIGGPYIQLGDSGGFETTGYVSVGTWSDGGGAGGTATTAFLLSTAGVAANDFHGQAHLTLKDAANNTWVCTSILYSTNGAYTAQSAGTKSLSGVLTQVRLGASSSGTFDAGSVNIIYK